MIALAGSLMTGLSLPHPSSPPLQIVSLSLLVLQGMWFCTLGFFFQSLTFTMPYSVVLPILAVEVASLSIILMLVVAWSTKRVKRGGSYAVMMGEVDVERGPPVFRSGSLTVEDGIDE